MIFIEHPSRDWAMPGNFPYDFDQWYLEASDTINEACRHARGFEVAVQAGGHVGVWPWLLSQWFDEVLTFEPDPENLECALENLGDCPNVLISPKTLGERIGTTQWHRSSDTGSHRIVSGDAGPIEMITIDSLELSACDLICLDVEGYEPFVIAGAEQTIAKYRPVITAEFRGHETFHGLAANATHNALMKLDYDDVATTHYDRVYKPKLI